MATTKSKTGGAEKKAGKQRAVTAAASAASASGTRNLIAWIERLNPSRVILLICVLAFAAYANSLGGDFVFDDTEQIVENPDVRSWDNLARAFHTHVWAFRERADVLRVPVPPPYYRPIFTVMLTLEYKLFGLWPQGWHLVSLLLHILCSIGVYYVLLMLSGRNLVAAVSALLFAVWPVHAESVSWISGMTDPLFGVFFLASFYYYLKFRADRKSPRSRLGYRHFVLSLAAFALAAFSKETALSLVAVIFAYEFIEAIYNRSGDKRTSVGSISAHFMNAIKRALPFAGVAVLYLIPRYLVLGGLTWKNPQAHNGPLVDTFLTLPLVVMSYLAHLAWPVNLSIAYMTHFVTSAASLEFLLPAFALVLISGALIVYRKKIGREAWHALALMFIPLILVLDLRQLSVEYLISDRYLYLSVAGWSYLIALGLAKLAAPSERESGSATSGNLSPNRRVSLGVTLLAIIMIGSIASTANENSNWTDSYSLWSNVARVRPGFWVAYYNTGIVLLDSRKFAEARAALDRAAALAPREPRVFDALGRAHDALGDRGDAVSNFKRAIEIDPAMFESLNNLGAVYFKAGEYPPAERYFGEALRVKPQAVAARFNLGVCYARQGRYEEAVREFEQVVRAAPEDAEAYYELGLAYEKAGRPSDALSALQRGLSFAKSEVLADKIAETLKRIQNERN